MELPTLPPDLFTSNRPPSNQELFSARELIATTRASQLIVQKRIADLQEEERALAKTIDAYECIASPLRRVPDDIIGEILLACTKNQPKVDIKVAPLLFLRISRRIRQVALGLPALWTGVTIKASLADRNSSDSVKSYLAVISEWLLVRSGALPLNIALSHNKAVGTHTKEQPQGLLDILLRCKSRWQEVTMNTRKDFPLQLITVDKACVPHLRALYLTDTYRQTDNSPSPDFSDSGLFQAPNLTRLRLWSERHSAFNPVPYTWAKLTFLEISGSAIFLESVLRETSCVVHMKLLCFDGIEEMAGGSEIIKLPHLKTFAIEDDSVDFGKLLGLIDAPSLKSFTCENEIDYVSEQYLLSFCSRIAGLETLYTDALHMDNVPAVLRRTPGLKELRINQSGICNNLTSNLFLDAFHTDDGGRVCPYLEVLYCEPKLKASKATVDRFYEINPPKYCQLNIQIVDQ